MRILAADDDELVRDILARLLAKLGASASVASSGERALEAYKLSLADAGLRFDAAFVDLDMPWSAGEKSEECEGGLRLAREIRAEEARSGSRSLALIALTGADGGRTGETARAGFDRFLQKPVGLDALAAELRRINRERGS